MIFTNISYDRMTVTLNVPLFVIMPSVLSAASNNNGDDDESPEAKLEREKLRRQQNNARER